MINLARAWPIAAVAMLSACAQLPVDGPSAGDIRSGASAVVANPPHTVAFDYAVVDISATVINALADAGPDSFFKAFGRPSALSQRAPGVRIGQGDVVEVAIFESSAGGLFLPPTTDTRTGNFVRTPPQMVSADGTISVPFAGVIRVAGRTVPEIQREIESKLEKRALEPQAILTVVEQNKDTVTVIGDGVLGSNKLKLTGAGERILDAIAKAGGLRYAAFDTFVTLRRKNRLVTEHFPMLVSSPDENVFLEPGDLIYVYRDQRKYVALGAIGATSGAASITGNTLVGAVGQFAFDQDRLSLNEALAKAGGLVDHRADPAQVYLYRMEYREALERMGVDVSCFPPDQKMIPTVYKANFRDPSAFFFAQSFPMRNRDTIYVGNADAVEVSKFLVYVREWTATTAGVTADGAVLRYNHP